MALNKSKENSPLDRRSRSKSSSKNKETASEAAKKAKNKATKSAKTSSATGTAENQPPLQSVNPTANTPSGDQNGVLQEEKLCVKEKAQKETSFGKDSREPLIPRPRGSNFSLQEAMMLEDKDEQYKGLRRAVRDAVCLAGADCQRTWRQQDFVKLSAIKAVVLQREPYFKKYEDEWPVGEFIRVHMKNTRAYQRHLEKEKAEDEDENGNGDGNGDGNGNEGNVERE
ncbi:hypothetical protein M378DRAFT_9636 [Amanita muscaria Koide BX008]|uniref:Uncharacterized protein n=1 Tax=Amanita muscaria (strain Koide BX008) TaxID=946122 RepID=A0A0C2XD96_AMAMK|nr:hypothetical protein M378DRAFT_9636 [Amanita muscaria Koide BX008]